MKLGKFVNYIPVKHIPIYVLYAFVSSLLRKLKICSKYSDLRIALTDAESLKFAVTKTNDLLLLRGEFEPPLFLRLFTSDIMVFRQVYLNKEYSFVIDFIKNNNVSIKTVVDVGANIGLTSRFFFSNLDEIHIACVEPDLENFKQLSLNLKSYGNVSTFNKALWHENEYIKISDSFRDGNHWSRQVEKANSEEGLILGVTMPDLFREMGFEAIDLLKVDIEGAEKQVFLSSSDISWIRKVNIIVMEIHDELVDRKALYNLLRVHDFSISNYGELTMAVNNSFNNISKA